MDWFLYDSGLRHERVMGYELSLGLKFTHFTDFTKVRENNHREIFDFHPYVKISTRKIFLKFANP